MYKANHVQQHSMFDNKLQMKLNSTNPIYINLLIFFLHKSFLFLLYKTFDQQIEAFLQKHLTNNVKIHKNLFQKKNSLLKKVL